MYFCSDNPAGDPHLFPLLGEVANASLTTCNYSGKVPPSYAGHACLNQVAIVLDFRSQYADENYVLARVCRLRIPPLFGHRVGAFHAPCGNSLFCFGCAALRVTVSLQISFGKTAEKISQEPP